MKNKSLEDELGFIADEEEDFGFIADEIPENELGFIPEPQQPTSQPQIQEQYEPLRQEQFVPGQPRLMQNISQSELTGQQDDLSKGTSPIDVRDAYGALKTAAPGFLKSAGGAVRKTEEIEFPFAQLTYNLNRYLPIGNIPAVKDLYNFWGVKDPYKDKPNQGDVLEALPEFSIIGKRRAEKGDYIKTVGKKLSDFANLTLDDIYQEYDVENANLPTRVLFGTVSSIAQQLPALATKNPTLILGAMGTQTFGTSYADARDSGLTSGKATMVGIFDGLSEIFTEYIGVGRLFKEYPSITRKILDVALADVPGEVVAELTQGLNNAINTNPDLTLNEIFKSSFVDAPLQALLQSAILGGGSKLLQRKKSKGATQAQQQAPQITPEIAPQTAQEQFQGQTPVELQQQATAEELMQQEQAIQEPQEPIEQPQEPTPAKTTTNIEPILKKVVEQAGGEFKGIQETVKGENLVTINAGKDTITVPISEATVDNIKAKIAEKQVVQEVEPIEQEARKYKSAEEFVEEIQLQKEHEEIKSSIDNIKENLSKNIGEESTPLLKKLGISNENDASNSISWKNMKEFDGNMLNDIKIIYNHLAEKENKPAILKLRFGDNPNNPFSGMSGVMEEGEINQAIVTNVKSIYNNLSEQIQNELNKPSAKANEQQLTDIWNKAQKKVAPKTQETKAEGKTKVSGLGKSIMREAIARGLAEDFGDLPTFQIRSQKGELADKVADFIENETELAKKIALLEAPEQSGMRSQEIFKALTIKAFAESDINTIEELAKSEKANAALTEYGQRVQASDTGLSNDPIKIIRGVIKDRAEYNKNNGNKKEINNLSAQLAEVEKKLALREKQIEQLERLRKEKIKKFGEGNKLFTKETYDKAQKSLRDRLGILSSGIDPVALVDLTKIGGYYFEGGLRNFTAWSQNLIEEFGIKVKPYLRKAWDKINTDFKEQEKTILESLNTLKKTKRLTKAELVEKVLESRIAEYERRIKEEDFSAMQKPGEKISTPRIEELKRILKVIKEEYKAIKPTQERTNEQRLKAYNTRIENEIKQLEKQLETLNFNKRVRRETILDVKTMRLKEQRDKLKLSVNAAKSVGENITKNEVENIVKLAKSLNDARDQIEESGDETANNEKNVRKYWLTRKNLEDYIEGLKPISKTDTANNLTNYMRASILASPRILRNSWIYQGVPGIERAITKRLITGAFSDADFKSNIIEKLIAKMSGIKVSAEDMAFIKKQVIMNIKIYHESGYDISRMDNLGDRSRYFGERAATIKGKGVFSKVGRFVNLAPKWLAGGTDMLFASISRADTALIMSKEIASIERQQNRLPKGMTEKQRARQLLIDSYQFEPKDKNAEDIRKAGIEDAHLMNGTQTEGWSDFVIKVRNLMTYKGINFGKVIIPFAKIANVVTAEGAKTATGIGIAKSIVNMGQATLSKNKDNRKAMMRKATSDLVRYSSFTLAATLIAGMLDDDDFVGSYDMIKGKRYGLAKARGAGANYIRIAGKWIPLRYLPYINIPISAIMTARQAKKRGANPIQGYLSGMIGQLLQSPGIAYGKDMATKIGWAINSKTPEKALSALGLDGKGLVDWAKVRMIPSVLSYDIYNALFPKEQKYDFMGREIEKGTFREDKTNSIILEFNKLDNKGQAPVIADPRGVYAIELEKKLGEEHYYRYLASLKREYTEKVQRKISSSEYKRLSAKDKKETIDKIRDDKILNKLRIKNRTTK
jgi:hypothetical protein